MDRRKKPPHAAENGDVAARDAIIMSSSSSPALALRKKAKKRLSSGSAAQRDESEFVSVEVGMREFQRRLASSKSKSTTADGRKKAAATTATASSKSAAPKSTSRSSSDQLRDNAGSAHVLPPAEDQPKKRARTTKAAATAQTTITATIAKQPTASAAAASTDTPRARKTTTAAAAVTSSSTAPSASSTSAPVKLPARKRAAAPAKSTPDTKSPIPTKAKPRAAAITTTAATGKPRAAPVARRQTTIAEIRAQLLREQQERVESRIQTLHCANCNSVTHADGHVHAAQAPPVSVNVAPAVVSVQAPTPGFISHYFQQQQQPQVVPSSPPPPPPPLPPPMFQAQPTAYSQAPASSSINSAVYTESPLTLAVPQAAAAAVTAQAVVPPPPSISIKNEFIEDDFDEDMAFMLALDQVEQSLTSTPTKAPAPFPPSMMYQQHHFVPVPQLFQQQQQQQQQATVIKQIESEIAGAGHHQQQQPTVGTHGGSSQYAPDVKPSREDLSQMQAPAMSADVQREFERLKRENELLRQSNELLQAAAASSSGSAVATAITTMASSPASFPSTVPPQIHHPAPATEETKPSSSSSPSTSSSDHVPAANSEIRCRPQMRATNPLQAVQTPQDQPLGKRFLNLGAAGAAGTIKQEETMVGTNDFSREGTHISEPASVNASERNAMHNLETGDRSQATYESTIPHGAEQRGNNLHSVPHHPGVLSYAAAPSGSPAPENRSVQNERNQASSADAQDVYQPDDPQSTVEEVREEDSERHREIEYCTLEGNDGGAGGEQSHAGDEDLHGDGIGGSQSADEDNEESDLSQSGDLNAADDEEEEEGYEASQEEVARASTIDRGNYQQYKAQAEDEDDRDFTTEDVGMDVNMGADETSRANEDDKPSDEHVDDADLPTLSSLPSRIGQKSVSTNLGVEANRLSGRSIDNSTALDDEINRSSTKLSATAAPSNTDDHRGEGISEKYTKREETSRVTEVDVTMQEAEDETIPYEESKSEIAVMKVDDEFNEVSAEEPTPKARVRVQEVSSSDSEIESDDDDNDNDDDDGNDADGGIANGLEAALKAAADSSGASTTGSRSSSAANSKSQQRGSFSLGATGSVSDQPKLSRESTSNNKSSSQAKKKRPRASDERSAGDISTGAPGKKIARSKHHLGSGMSSGNSSNSSVKSTLLWPALDDFYEFILGLSPRRIEVPEKYESNLRRYFRGTLPAKYSSLNEYTSVQIEAIMEELAASVRSSEQFSHQNISKSLFLTSVSPCGRGFNGGQQSSSLLPSGQQLNSSTIFMESGFSGTTSGSNDFILTFHANVPGRGGSSSSDFSSGDLVLLRSPRWKQYEMVVYGVVLCNSVVAIGGSSGSGSGGGGRGGRDQDNDLICVLIRTQERDHANPKEKFSVLTEMCLANQRSTQWRWRLEQVHNLTTSAREFQAMKSVNFFSPSIKRSLLDGKMSASESQKEKSGNGKTPATSGTNAAAGEPKSRLTPALHRELEKKYNSSQLNAILGCIGEENHVIIQGPPGTGKTKTILGVLSALLDGAAVGGAKRSKESTRIRVGASLKDGNASSGPRIVAESSIRILVAAPSNAAVDELIVRLLSEGVYDGVKCCSYRPRIVRVGRPESLQQQREPSESSKGGNEGLKTDSKKIKKKKWRKYAQEVEEILLENLVTKHKSSFPNAKMARQGIVKNAQIVFCTLSGAGSVAMCDFAHEFDALVIDEAAQAVEASALIPFKFRPNRVILVGDHRQLPATVISKRLIDIGYDRSLFQRFVENGSQVFLLNRQYRMHPDISEFPSRYFYKGKLVQDAKMSDWTARKYHADKLFKPFVFYDVLSGQQSQVSGSKSLRNLTEVEFILLLVRGLLKKYPEMDWKKKIGIIAPYKQQIYELGSHLSRLEKDVDQRLDIEVNTVDGFQGREKEIIIYSCVRTSGGGGNRRKNNSQDKLDAFWADERRMNVAITRAKSSLWIVGNSQLLEQSRAWRALIRTAKDRDKYMRNTDVEL